MVWLSVSATGLRYALSEICRANADLPWIMGKSGDTLVKLHTKSASKLDAEFL